MRAAGVVVLLLTAHVASVRVARAQPGMTNPIPTGAELTTPPAAPSASAGAHELRYGLGVDVHLAFGEIVHQNIGVRGELIFAPHHTLVLRAGVGSAFWLDTELDDPIFREWFGRVGYRLSSTHIYAGVELGRSMYQARWDAYDDMPARKGEWFGTTTATALVGWKLGPVDLGFDYTRESDAFGAFGVFVGGGFRQPRKM
jgi:hypothetical protein